VPLVLEEQHVSQIILSKLQLTPPHACDTAAWGSMARRVDEYTEPVSL
jgi:hypothetical protein